MADSTEDVVRRIVDHPNAVSPLADLYLAGRGRTLTMAKDKRIYKLDDGNWRELDVPDLHNDMKHFLDDALNHFMVTRRETLQFAKAITTIELLHNRKAIVRAIRTKLDPSV